MRLVTLILATLIVLLQYPLWLGSGGWLSVWQLEEQLESARKENQRPANRNQSLLAEVNNLKTGTEAAEERARSELGMIKPDEVFFQVLKPGTMPVVSQASASAAH